LLIAWKIIVAAQHVPAMRAAHHSCFWGLNQADL